MKKLLVGLVAIASLLGVSGCAQSSNTAATVGDMVITEDYVQSSAHYLVEALAAEPAYNTFNFAGFVLANTITEKVLADSLAEMGITISDEQREQQWASMIQPGTITYALWDDPVTRQTLYGLIDSTMVQTAAQMGNIDANKLQTLIDAIPVTLNPRYGTWNSTALNISTRITDTPTGPYIPAGSLADQQLFTLPS